MADKNGMTEEQWVRFGVGLGHMFGSIAASAFGAGAAVQPMAQIEDQIITAAYAGKKDSVSPGPVVNNEYRARVASQTATQAHQAAQETPPIIDQQRMAAMGIRF